MIAGSAAAGAGAVLCYLLAPQVGWLFPAAAVSRLMVTTPLAGPTSPAVEEL